MQKTPVWRCKNFGDPAPASGGQGRLRKRWQRTFRSGQLQNREATGAGGCYYFHLLLFIISYLRCFLNCSKRESYLIFDAVDVEFSTTQSMDRSLKNILSCVSGFRWSMAVAFIPFC